MVSTGHSHKYARIERERRFLLERLPFADSSGPPYINIIDTYLPGGQLRLRLMRDESGTPIAYKLTQKYHLPTLPNYATVITNLYLTPADYHLFDDLPGAIVRKRRYHVVEGEVSYSVDVFGEALQGLILAEVERTTDAELAALPLPAFALREVTADPAFRGGRLAHLTPAAFRRWQASGFLTLVNQA